MFAEQIDDQPKQVPRRLEKSLLASGMRQLPGLRIEVVPTVCSTSRLTPNHVRHGVCVWSGE